ncbi:phytanoyl-CoA dioxygenase family protein [Zobellella maritima]|uniref:phytanoyl-CoA dioxygenase family protein n=1 Tax=Zobellella maritima TaxID=2059725 RepID=UPI000E30570A|nr:phytanoyl-CoA dioxygenase family protein [Zobellella maritima]
MQTLSPTLLTQEQKEAYERDGAIVIKGVFKDWIAPLREGFEQVLRAPGPHGRENVASGAGGRFFEDYCNWQRIPEFKRWIEESPGAAIAGDITGSDYIQVFHEHILVKEPGTSKPTPWHQDMPYYCVNGEKTASYWIPLDPVTRDNTLQVVLGSHKWPSLIRPSRWSTNESWYNDDSQFMEMPDIDGGEFDILTPELELGDALIFNFKTVHGAPGNPTRRRRRAFSTRFMGDDVRFAERGGATSPPFTGIGLRQGDIMREDWFPVVWRRNN